MKLNYKRTLLVGLAFLSICAFWQLYDNVVPLILKNTFDIPDDIAGVIMALDNVLALFLLPLFGKLSDRTHTRLGRRMPYILGGTLAAVVLMNLLPVADAARSLWLFVVALGLLLLAMGVYRSPAVALMPDVTPKPLRSKGNAIINLMGTLGGVFTLAATGLLVTRDATGRENYSALFLAVSILMLAAVVVLLLTIRENRLAREVELQNLATQGEDATQAQADETPSTGAGFSSLDPALRRSLILILCSVSLWFMGYNAVTTAFTKYVSVQWGYDIKAASQCLMVATVGAVVSYLPVGFLSSRFGRKRVIQAGVLLLAACFGTAALFAQFSPVLSGGSGLGHDQRQFLPHGGGDLQERRRGQVHRLLLHLLHGRADRHAHCKRLAAGARGVLHAFALCGGDGGAVLRHHQPDPPRRQPAPAAAQPAGGF